MLFIQIKSLLLRFVLFQMRVTAVTPSRATAARCTWTWRRRARPWRGTAATPATPSRQTRTPGTAGQTASGADSRRNVHVRCLMYFYVFILSAQLFLEKTVLVFRFIFTVTCHSAATLLLWYCCIQFPSPRSPLAVLGKDQNCIPRD